MAHAAEFPIAGKPITLVLPSTPGSAGDQVLRLLADKLKDDWFNGDRMQTATITYPDGGVLSGTFFLASYTDTGAYNDATTFQAELQSSGPVSYTPPA